MMHKYKVRFFTNVMFTGGTSNDMSSDQAEFSAIYGFGDAKEIKEVAKFVADDLDEHTWLQSNDSPHFFRTSIVTDFSIEKLEDEK